MIKDFFIDMLENTEYNIASIITMFSFMFSIFITIIVFINNYE